MAGHASDLAQLELIKRRELTEPQKGTLNALALAMRPDAPEAAAEAARQLDSLCPPLDRGEEAESYFWSTWDIMLAIAGSPDVEDEVQGHLVCVLEELKKCDKGGLDVNGKRVWRDLPLFAMCYDAHYTDLTDHEKIFNTKDAQIWYKISIFGALGLAAGVLAPWTYVMYAIQGALEHNLTTLPLPKMAEWRVKVACAWLIRGAAKPLLLWAQENASYDNVQDEGNHIEPGPLYAGYGPEIMCFERWQFWMGRLQELAMPEPGLSEETRQAAGEAAQMMWEVQTTWEAHTIGEGKAMGAGQTTGEVGQSMGNM